MKQPKISSIALLVFWGLSFKSFPPMAQTVIFQKTFGGSKLDIGYCVKQTTDGGYILVGDTDNYGAGSRDVYLIKTNATGDAIWTKTFGGDSRDEGYSVQQTVVCMMFREKVLSHSKFIRAWVGNSYPRE